MAARRRRWAAQARVKRCGKSAPASGAIPAAGNPHPEQGQAWDGRPGRCPQVGRTDGWPPGRRSGVALQNPAYRPAHRHHIIRPGHLPLLPRLGPQPVLSELAAHLARFDPGPDGLIFTGENGRAVARNRAADVVRATATKAGAPEVRFHDLRHFSASALIPKGLSVKVVQARLGHGSAVETLDVYGHLWPDDEDRTRQAVDELLGGELAEDWLRTEAGE